MKDKWHPNTVIGLPLLLAGVYMNFGLGAVLITLGGWFLLVQMLNAYLGR